MSTQTTATSFKPGQKTNKVWCGDIASQCEFIRPLTRGGLLFWDKTFKCFRRAYWEELDGEMILNGWESSGNPFEA